MAHAVRITGVGCYLPERVLTNDDLARMVDTTDEWIQERSGIRERRIAAPSETASSLGAEAARIALASAGIEATDIDLVLSATCTPDGMFPATATRIQHAIGATGAGSFDINAACTGFLLALSTASQFIETGSAQRVLIVGTEVLSRIVNWGDRTTCVLFGDGAGAVVLERATAAGDGSDSTGGATPGEMSAFVMHSDGGQAGLLYSDGPASARTEGFEAQACIVMDGRNVFRHAVSEMSAGAEEALAQAGLTIDDIDLCIPHQANLRIIQAMTRNLGMDEDRVFVNLDRYGNTSAATIPIALAEAAAAGRLQPGDRVLMAAFGGGLTWGAMVIEWAGVRQAPPPVAPATGSAAELVAGAVTRSAASTLPTAGVPTAGVPAAGVPTAGVPAAIASPDGGA